MATKAPRTQAKAGGYRCSECGWTTIKWVGRCGECQAWGVGQRDRCGRASRTTAAVVVDRPAMPDRRRRRAPGRGTPAPGSASSTGSSAAAWCPAPWCWSPASRASASPPCCSTSPPAPRREGQTVLYVSGEESAAQVRVRAERIEAMATHALPRRRDRPGHRARPDRAGPARPGRRRLGADHRQRRGRGLGRQRHPGPRGRRRRSSRWPSPAASPSLLVGHVTKDGSIAGPAGARAPGRRGRRSSRATGTPGCGCVRAVKNRYGPTDEVGCFDLSDVGIVGLLRPQRAVPVQPRPRVVPGTCVTVTLEGRRPLVAEVQALVAPSVMPDPAADHQRPRRLARRDDPRRPRPPGRRAGAPGRRATSPPSAACA